MDNRNSLWEYEVNASALELYPIAGFVISGITQQVLLPQCYLYVEHINMLLTTVLRDMVPCCNFAGGTYTTT
jgi:hypothetical protein